ncbi:restriction endonuclease subunit S [Kurthia sp. FSL E2-0154]|uniref:restriction endonuclease subunit S n=1 Tax=Kurthia sp. FSL E2-0154 TaxID=2921358 RepID=UPI0030F55C38
MSKIKELDVPWLGDLPENWRVLKLKYLCEINTGSKDTQDKIPDGKYPFFVRSPHIESLNEFTHDEEAVMTAGDGVGVGKVFHYYEGKFAAHQRVYVFTKFKNVLGKYLYYYVMSNLKFEVLMGGAKSTVDSLRRPMLSEFPVVFPMINVQDKIVKYLDRKVKQLNYLINSKEKYISLLEKQRQSIITEAVTKGLNPNVKMKDSGVEWIGEIPEHWSILPLKYIASEKKNSFVDGPFGSDLKNEEYVDSGVPVIQLNNIKNGKLRINNMNYVSEEKSEQLRRHTAYPDDLVIAKMASPIARSAVVPNMFQKYVIVADCVKLKLKENYSNAYINYAMNTPFTIAQAEAFANGTTRSRVNLGIIKNLKVPIPHFEEQKEIVSYLEGKISEMDNVIKSVEKQIEKLKEYRQSLIYEAVTGKIDVRDMELD